MGKQIRCAVGGDKQCYDETQKGSNVRIVVRDYHTHCILYTLSWKGDMYNRWPENSSFELIRMEDYEDLDDRFSV